jgi:hypothetical protein
MPTRSGVTIGDGRTLPSGAKAARRNGRSPYDVMEKDICVTGWRIAAHDPIHSYVATYPKLPDALEVSALGLAYKLLPLPGPRPISWASPLGLGYWTRQTLKSLLATQAKRSTIESLILSSTHAVNTAASLMKKRANYPIGGRLAALNYLQGDGPRLGCMG